MTRIGAILEVLAALLVGAALARAVAGPLRFDLFDTTITLRTAWRPLVAAALLLIVRIWIEVPAARRAIVASSAARIVAGSVLCGGVLGWIVFLSTTCGGADSYGYVSAAERLLTRTLVKDETLASILPLSDAIGAATPLGYTPSTQVRNASVPVYPLGLPALMAGALTFVGRDGPFFVAPVMGLVLLCAVYMCAYSLSHDRVLALFSAALPAVHPVVFTYAIQPMSDVPAAALFMVAVAALVHDRPRPLLAGVAGGVCLLTRPALAPALAALAAIPSVVAARLDGRAAAIFAIPLAAGVAVQLIIQWYLYGHPLANGYGDVGTLFSSERIWVNARSHSYWAWLTLGPIFAGATAIGLSVLSRASRIIIALVGAGVAAPYLAYRTFDHWETLRFLLPALVLLTIPAAAGMIAVSRYATGKRGGVWWAALLLLVVAHTWTSWLRDQTVFAMPEQETRYRVAGELVSQATPARAVILAALHSGSIRYYAGRQSVNWDRIPMGALPTTIAALQNAGHPVYLLLDGAEERAMFEHKHGSIADWLPNGQRRNVQLLEAPQMQAR